MTAPSVSTRLPSAADLQAEIDRLTSQLTSLDTNPFGATKNFPTIPGLPGGVGGAPAELPDFLANSPFITVLGARQRLQGQIADKQKQLDLLKHPTDTSGVPPAPDAAPVLGPTITAPKVGINDLTIPLPR